MSAYKDVGRGTRKGVGSVNFAHTRRVEYAQSQPAQLWSHHSYLLPEAQRVLQFPSAVLRNEGFLHGTKIIELKACLWGSQPLYKIDILQMPQVLSAIFQVLKLSLGTFCTALTAVSALIALCLWQTLVSSRQNSIENVFSQRVFHRANGGTQPVLCGVHEAFQVGTTRRWADEELRDAHRLAMHSPPGEGGATLPAAAEAHGDIARLRGGSR
jgi:hypothetical protein